MPVRCAIHSSEVRRRPASRHGDDLGGNRRRSPMTRERITIRVRRRLDGDIGPAISGKVLADLVEGFLCHQSTATPMALQNPERRSAMTFDGNAVEA